MIKKLSFSLYFICFFGFIVYAYGSQLKNTFENQLLSSIYSEYNNDYLIWEKLPKYNFVAVEVVTGVDRLPTNGSLL